MSWTKAFPCSMEFEVHPGTFSMRRKMCEWIEEQNLKREVLGWKYDIGSGIITLSVCAIEEKYLDVFILVWGQHLTKLTHEETE